MWYHIRCELKSLFQIFVAFFHRGSADRQFACIGKCILQLTPKTVASAARCKRLKILNWPNLLCGLGKQSLTLIFYVGRNDNWMFGRAIWVVGFVLCAYPNNPGRRRKKLCGFFQRCLRNGLHACMTTYRLDKKACLRFG